MRTIFVLTTFSLAVSAALGTTPPSRQEVQAGMGLRSEGDLVRGQRDTVGFVVTAARGDDVLRAVEEREPPEAAGAGAVAVVVPHDDHLYAADVAVHATRQVRAPVVLLIGVFHAAREWSLADRLVFDSFTAWHGPWGPVTVDGLREELLGGLGVDDVVVDNAMHEREHSLEALLVYLQGAQRDVRIVPVLVPYMAWPRLEELAGALAEVLQEEMDERGWRLGRDLAVVISSDSVHYGPDFDHAPFGTTAAAYQQAVDRDVDLVQEHLEGPLDGARLRGFLGRLVDPDDPRVYRIPWCGRFSIPFGLEVVRRIAVRRGEPAPAGQLLAYGTSLSDPLLEVSETTLASGLGTTAPANLHHWVGYASLAWWGRGAGPSPGR